MAQNYNPFENPFFQCLKRVEVDLTLVLLLLNLFQHKFLSSEQTCWVIYVNIITKRLVCKERILLLLLVTNVLKIVHPKETLIYLQLIAKLIDDCDSG